MAVIRGTRKYTYEEKRANQAVLKFRDAYPLKKQDSAQSKSENN